MTDWPPQRLSAPDPAHYSDHQQRIHDTIASGPRGGVRGPLAIWLHRPELAENAQALGRYCRFDTSLPNRLSELAIITIARIWGAEYEWHAHKAKALEAGIDPAIVEAIRRNRTPDFADEDAAAVHAFTRAALIDRQVDDALYDRTLAALGRDGLVDLVGILGYYSLISVTINAFRIPPHDGGAPELGGA